ncbi:hypothetical protein CSUB01_12100 [Colletotrichum sublineola]|uniref:Uncharacterized protein n=1 Tax=Colletotrichum sublineola TaxID=1173701 RepID=A0A066XG30_COLSU|nr:hypothetical protein CSUB01_12100 [Colletotrichum sublineola]
MKSKRHHAGDKRDLQTRSPRQSANSAHRCPPCLPFGRGVASESRAGDRLARPTRGPFRDPVAIDNNRTRASTPHAIDKSQRT